MVPEALSPELLFPQLIKMLMIEMNKVAVFFVVFMGPLKIGFFGQIVRCTQSVKHYHCSVVQWLGLKLEAQQKPLIFSGERQPPYEGPCLAQSEAVQKGTDSAKISGSDKG